MDMLISPPAPAAPAPAPAAAGVSDRINELYRGEIFTAESSRIARDRVHWMCSQCEGDRVLDVGCSQGITAILLAREGLTVTAIDSDPATLRFAANEIARETRQVQRRVTLVDSDLASLPLDEHYDTVVLGEVLEHQALPERFLGSAAARVKVGGRLVVTTPFALHPHDDHKISVMPRHVVEIATRLGLQIDHLDVSDGYIRAVLTRTAGAPTHAALPDVLALTEAATLASQRRLYDRLDERAEQLRKRSEAMKLAQKKLADATAAVQAADAAAQAAQQRHAAKIEQLGATHLQALQASRAEHEEALARGRAALASADEIRVAGESALAALRAEHATAIEQLRASAEAELGSWRDKAAAEALNAHRLGEAVAVSEASRRAAEAALARAQREHERAMAALRTGSAKELAELHESLEVRAKAQIAQALRKPTARIRALQHFEEKSGLLDRQRLALTMEIKALRRSHHNEKENLRTQVKTLRSAAVAMREASSYRLGRAMIRAVKSPRGLIALPGELVSIARSALARRRARAQDDVFGSAVGDPVQLPSAPKRAEKTAVRPAAAKPTPAPLLAAVSVPLVKARTKATPAAAVALDLNALVALYKSRGMDALKAELAPPTEPHRRRAQCISMLQVGKALFEQGDEAADFELVSAALAIERSDATLRGYFWAAQRAKRFDEALEALRGLEELYGPQPTPEQEAILTRLRLSPSGQLALLKLVPKQAYDKLIVVPRRICYILHNSLPYSSGGYGTRSHGVASGLTLSGYEMVLMTRPGFPLDMKPELDEASVAKEETIDGIRYVRTLEPARRGKSSLDYVNEAADALEQRFRELRPALVMAASNHLTALPALIAARRLGLPFVYEVRGLWEVTRMSREPEYVQTPQYDVQRLLEAHVAQSADHVFTLTEPMREELVSRGLDASRVDLLPNSCDPTRFVPRARDEALAQRLGIPAGVPVIGYIGTFVDYEGLGDLALSCALLKRNGTVFRLLLVGNENTSGTDRGPITEQIENVAASEGFSDWLVMPGRVPHEEVESYYSLIDIAPFPRKALPVCEMVSPLKPLEALAMEKAVLVSSVRALAEMISDGHTGRVFDKGDVVALADRLTELIADPDARGRLGRNGRQWVCAERTWQHIGAKFDAIVTRVLPDAPGLARVPVVFEPAAQPAAEVPTASAAVVESTSAETPRPAADSASGDKPEWWEQVDDAFRARCGFMDLRKWKTGALARELRERYVKKFGEEAVARRMPTPNWARADICAHTVVPTASLLDVGSGLGEFVNLIALRQQHGVITSVDLKDYDLWMDVTGSLRRVYRDVFALDTSLVSDVVTCFEVIEHLPPQRVAEAVAVLRSLARRKLYVSVPFMEPLPLYRGHHTQFGPDNLAALFPDARFTVFGKGAGTDIRAWIMCEVDIAPVPANAESARSQSSHSETAAL